MSRYIRGIMVAIATFVVASHSIDPPWMKPPYPWGRDTTEWVWYSLPWGPTEAIYNPAQEAFYVCGSTPVQWPTLQLELFIEMELEIDVGNPGGRNGGVYSTPSGVTYIHGYTQSDYPPGVQIIPFGFHTLDRFNLETREDGSSEKPYDAGITWEISTDAGRSYRPMSGDDMVRYHNFESWYNRFIIKVWVDPTLDNSYGQYRMEAALCSLPQH